MIKIAISQAAFEAIAKTLPLGSVGYENKVNERGERLIWLEPNVVNRLRALRGPWREQQRCDFAGRGGKLTGDGRSFMADIWKLTFTVVNRPPGTRTFDNETDFISVVLDKLSDLRTSDVSAVLPDGTKLDEAALRAKYAK